MRHSLHAEGFGVRLRPVQMNDAAFIVWLRHLDHAKGKLGDSAADVAGQKTWLKTYFDREGDCYFIAETPGGIPVGTHGIYDKSGTSAEWGRFVMRPEVPAALPASIISFDLAFGPLGLKEVRATSVASNRTLHSYILKLGFRQTRVETAGRIIGGNPVDMLHFILMPEDWFKCRERVLPLARLAEAQVLDWEQQQFRNRNLHSGGAQ
jgi:RimJ/RimL family protein N-acetyltransferase